MTEPAKTIEELQDIVDKQAMTIRRLYAERYPDTWFVCGEVGKPDNNGLPEYVMLCPAYGCDWAQLYQRTDKTTGPEW